MTVKRGCLPGRYGGEAPLLIYKKRERYDSCHYNNGSISRCGKRHHGMELNLSSAHAPFFIPNIVIVTDSHGRPAWEKYREDRRSPSPRRNAASWWREPGALNISPVRSQPCPAGFPFATAFARTLQRLCCAPLPGDTVHGQRLLSSLHEKNL